MSVNNSFDSNWPEMVAIPIRRVDSRWEFFYGGDVPVRDGALGQLAIDAASITDKQFLERVTQVTEVKILEEGTALVVALSDRQVKHIEPWGEVAPEDVPAGATRFERVVIGPPKRSAKRLAQQGDGAKGGLWLRFKGLERSELTSSTILMPDGFLEKTATSLNHAFTLLSRAYETHRISNTGSVYRQCFYQEANQRWYPLADLRAGARVQGERALITAAWKQVEEALGWRPLVVADRRKKKRPG